MKVGCKTNGPAGNSLFSSKPTSRYDLRSFLFLDGAHLCQPRLCTCSNKKHMSRCMFGVNMHVPRTLISLLSSRRPTWRHLLGPGPPQLWSTSVPSGVTWIQGHCLSNTAAFPSALSIRSCPGISPAFTVPLCRLHTWVHARWSFFVLQVELCWYGLNFNQGKVNGAAPSSFHVT